MAVLSRDRAYHDDHQHDRHHIGDSHVGDHNDDDHLDHTTTSTTTIIHAERKDPGVTRIGCLTHARRRFYQALRESFPDALWFISRLRQLYRIEDQVRFLAPEQRYQIRQQQAPSIWEALKERAQELKPKLLPQCTLGQAVNYFLKEYAALLGYLQDGRFKIDNNLVENDIRPSAVGRKRWLFIGHPQAGWRSAEALINPQDYLTNILARLPSSKITHLQRIAARQLETRIGVGRLNGTVLPEHRAHGCRPLRRFAP